MWTRVASACCDGSRLDLYERNGLHMIRADGWELMSGAYHASEDELGRLVGVLARGAYPEILVGGLGLGYTLASLLETLNEGGRPGRARITVAERSSAVLRWFASHTNPRLAATLPAGVRLIESDVLAYLDCGRRWDVIVLDVDNGPEALSAPGNAVLYGEQGLARCRDSLAPRGHLLLWSGFEDLGFVERAGAVGFSVARRFVNFPDRSDEAHLIYVLSRTPLSSADRGRVGLDGSASGAAGSDRGCVKTQPAILERGNSSIYECRAARSQVFNQGEIQVSAQAASDHGNGFSAPVTIGGFHTAWIGSGRLVGSVSVGYSPGGKMPISRRVVGGVMCDMLDCHALIRGETFGPSGRR